jgi:hypothetical protein
MFAVSWRFSSMKNAKGKLLTTLCLLLMLFIVFGPYGDSRVSAVDSSTYKSLKLFNEVLDMVEKNYVEEVKQKTDRRGRLRDDQVPGPPQRLPDAGAV